MFFGGVLCCFFCGAVLSLPCVPGFSRVACVFFPSASSLFAYSPLSSLFQGCFLVSCPYLAFFSCSSCCFFCRSSLPLVSPRSLSRVFSEGAPGFFVFSPLRCLPLLLLLLGVLRLLLPFVLLVCRVLPLRGFFRVMPFSLLSLRLLRNSLCFE